MFKTPVISMWIEVVEDRVRHFIKEDKIISMSLHKGGLKITLVEGRSFKFGPEAVIRIGTKVMTIAEMYRSEKFLK